MREFICYLAKHKLINAIHTTAGAIEEDFMKCFNPTFVGKFENDEKYLRDNGINLIGNMYVPNKNYCKFEDFLAP